jgi:hypothetical protein
MNMKTLMIGFVSEFIIPKVAEIKHKDRLEMMQIDPNADLPVELIAAKLREQIRMCQIAQQ